MTVVVVFFLAFILAVVIGQKAKINAGFLAIAFVFKLFIFLVELFLLMNCVPPRQREDWG